MSFKIIFFPLSIVVALIIFIWMIKPEWDSLSQAKLNVQAAKEALAKVDGEIIALNKAYDSYLDLDSGRQLVLNALPYENKKDELVSELFQKVKSSEVMLSSMGIKEGEKKEGSCVTAAQDMSTTIPVDSEETSATGSAASSPTFADAQPASLAVQVANCLKSESVELKLSGEYLKLRNFMAEVEKMNRYVEVESLEVLREAQSTDGSSSVVSYFPEATVADNPSPESVIPENEKLEASVILNIYYKEPSTMFKLAQFKNDESGRVIFQGKISDDVILELKNTTTSEAYPAVNAGGYGKEDLFKPAN